MSGKIDQKQVAEVMRTFNKGKLRDSHGKKVTSESQAKAIAMREGRSAVSQGKSKRTWKGRTRTRPNLK